MAKKKINRLTEVGIFFGVFTVIVIVIQFTLGRHLVKLTNQLKGQFDAKQKELRGSEELIRKYPNPQKAIEEIEQKEIEFKDIEINKRQLPRIIHLLGRAGTEYGLHIISIRPRDDIAIANESLPTGVTKVYVEIVLNGTYKKIGDYLADLPKLQGGFFLETITVEKISERSAPAAAPEGRRGPTKAPEPSAQLSAVLVVSTYMLWEL